MHINIFICISIYEVYILYINSNNIINNCNITITILFNRFNVLEIFCL